VSGYKFDENTRIPIGIRHEGAATFYQVPMRPGVTFSPWYDPAVLGKGIHAKLQMSKQLGVLYGNYKILRDLFLVNYGILVLAWLVLFLANPSLRGFRHWPLLLVALSGLGLYCAVLIEARYISAFVLVVFGSLLGGATLPRDTASLRYSRMTLLGATALLGFLALPSLVSYLEFRTRPSVQLEVAQRLQSLHLAPDEAVAIIGDPQWQFWPQAAHLRISGVVPPRQAAAFCGLEPALRDGVVRSLASAGAQLTVVELKDLPPPEGCSTLAGTDYCTIGRQP
jgi:hypothetical protein